MTDVQQETLSSRLKNAITRATSGAQVRYPVEGAPPNPQMQGAELMAATRLMEGLTPLGKEPGFFQNMWPFRDIDKNQLGATIRAGIGQLRPVVEGGTSTGVPMAISQEQINREGAKRSAAQPFRLEREGAAADLAKQINALVGQEIMPMSGNATPPGTEINPEVGTDITTGEVLQGGPADGGGMGTGMGAGMGDDLPVIIDQIVSSLTRDEMMRLGATA
jgi:hypothetical protein